MLNLNEYEFREKFKNSPIKRAKLEGLKRNVCVALGNSQNPKAIPALTKMLYTETELIKIHAAWALGQIGGKSTRKTLQNAYEKEISKDVQKEISLSLKDMDIK